MTEGIWETGGCQCILKNKVSFTAFPGLEQGRPWTLDSADFFLLLSLSLFPWGHTVLYHPDPSMGELWVCMPTLPCSTRRDLERALEQPPLLKQGSFSQQPRAKLQAWPRPPGIVLASH